MVGSTGSRLSRANISSNTLRNAVASAGGEGGPVHHPQAAFTMLRLTDIVIRAWEDHGAWLREPIISARERNMTKMPDRTSFAINRRTMVGASVAVAFCAGSVGRGRI